MMKIFQNRLFSRIANRKGMELLQMVVLIAIVIALGSLLLAVLNRTFPEYVEALMSKLTGTFTGDELQ